MLRRLLLSLFRLSDLSDLSDLSLLDFLLLEDSLELPRFELDSLLASLLRDFFRRESTDSDRFLLFLDRDRDLSFLSFLHSFALISSPMARLLTVEAGILLLRALLLRVLTLAGLLHDDLMPIDPLMVHLVDRLLSIVIVFVLLTQLDRVHFGLELRKNTYHKCVGSFEGNFANRPELPEVLPDLLLGDVARKTGNKNLGVS